jgi:hypothetical protein
MQPEVALLICLVAMCASLWMSMWLDRIRIRRHFAAMGASVQSQRWLPFGRGWIGSLHETIYRVHCIDRDGKPMVATVRTSVLTGVHVDEMSAVGE